MTDHCDYRVTGIQAFYTGTCTVDTDLHEQQLKNINKLGTLET